jgi:uncharacterized membrane protein YbhN (UPF0104 family)
MNPPDPAASRQPTPPSRPRLGRPRDWLIGAALLAAVLIAIDHTVGWRALLAPWTTLSPWLLAVAFLLTAASYGLRAVRVHAFFQPLTAGRFGTVLRLSVLHNTANNLLPMRSGEMVFPWLMRRYFGHGFLAAGASLVWIRLLDLHFLGLIGLLVLWLRDPAWLWLLLALPWIALLPAAALLRRLDAGGRAGEGRLRRLVRFVANAGPGDTRRIAGLYGWTALSWTLKLIAFAVILRHFVPVEFWRVLAGVMGAELSSVLPFHGIAGTGSYELATVVAMVPFGVDPEQALAGAVNLHLFLLGTTVILGLLALLIPVRREGGTGAGEGPGQDDAASG